MSKYISIVAHLVAIVICGIVVAVSFTTQNGLFAYLGIICGLIVFGKLLQHIGAIIIKQRGSTVRTAKICYVLGALFYLGALLFTIVLFFVAATT